MTKRIKGEWIDSRFAISFDRHYSRFLHVYFLLRVIAHDKPERRNVSMHPGPRHHSRNFFGELEVFSASMLFRLFVFLSFDSPSQRIHALRVYNWQFYSGSLSSAFSYSTLFRTHCSLWNCLATYRKTPFFHCNLKGNDSTPLISNHHHQAVTIYHTRSLHTRYKCFVTFTISRCVQPVGDRFVNEPMLLPTVRKHAKGFFDSRENYSTYWRCLILSCISLAILSLPPEVFSTNSVTSKLYGSKFSESCEEGEKN